ncbi:MAG: Asp/Glu racemase [Paracoccaceae bacterium]
MAAYDYDLDTAQPPRLGMVVLQTDEQLERDFRQLIPSDVALYVSRVPSGAEVSPESLQEMETHLEAAAGLLPAAYPFRAVGYGCTSGTAQIGSDRIAELVVAGTWTQAVTEPVSALVAACRHLGIKRLALLSPYVENVSSRLRTVLAEAGIETPVFGSFDEAEEVKVARIHPDSIVTAAVDLAEDTNTEALFLSCTNLRGVEAGPEIARRIGRPVLSSNLVLAWHLCQLAGVLAPELDYSE